MTESNREWIFTFGWGSEYKDRFVAIVGTFDSARAEMVHRYGQKWGFQYESRDAAGVSKWNLREIDAEIPSCEDS